MAIGAKGQRAKAVAHPVPVLNRCDNGSDVRKITLLGLRLIKTACHEGAVIENDNVHLGGKPSV